MFILHAENGQGSSVMAKKDGFSSFWMYATLSLKVVSIDEENKKTYVEPHWIGVASIRAEDGRDISCTQHGATPHQSSALPSTMEELILLRPGLPPTPFTAFVNLLPVQQPLWWSDWKKRSELRNGDFEEKLNTVAWDFGAALDPFPQETEVTVRDAGGSEGKVSFKWFQVSQTQFDVTFKARLENEQNQSQKEAAEFINATIKEQNWLSYLARIAWMRGVTPLTQTEKDVLPLSFCAHLALPAGGEFVASQFGSRLSRMLSHFSTSPLNGNLKLLTYSHEISTHAKSYLYSERDLRLWPPPIQVEEPLRFIPPPSSEVMERLLNIQSELQILKELDAKFSLHGASEHKYLLKPCLDERAIQNFENKYNIVLPDEYRSFLLYI
jgi:hypothetical protein